MQDTFFFDNEQRTVLNKKVVQRKKKKNHPKYIKPSLLHIILCPQTCIQGYLCNPEIAVDPVLSFLL